VTLRRFTPGRHTATLCASGPDRWGYHYYQERRSSHLDPRDPVNRRRWLDISRKTTTGDRTAMISVVAGVADKSFRLVDAHGKSTGPRYRNLAKIRPLPPYDSYLCEDQHGRRIWLRGDTRIRVVAAQPEDLYSLFSRMLKAAHKRS
jgi:hypothetical protein